MKIVAASACQSCLKAVFGSFLAAALLGACSLPLPDKPVRPEPYDLGPPLPLASAAATSSVALGIDAVESSAAIDGTAVVYRLLYSGDGQQPRPYASARWTMSPPQLVTQRLREAFAATRPVVDGGMGLAPLELRAQLDDFTHVFQSATASEGVVRLRVTLVMPTGQATRLLGQRTFVARQPAATPDAAGGVGALRRATDEVVRQAVEWVGSVPVPAQR
jgi:cholesterol transport system auxiliary component